MAMWSFYYRHTKQKADRWQNMCFRLSNVSCCSLTIKCIWLQYLLIFLFCLDCSCSPAESPISGSKSSVESLHAKSYFRVLKKRSRVSEMQNSVTRIPVWEPAVLKSGLKALNAISMLESQTILVNSHKHSKQRRLFKRAIKNNASSPELTAIFTEIPRITSGKTLYQLPELEEIESVSSSNLRSLPSFPGEHLRSSLLNKISLDNLLIRQSSGYTDLWEMQTSTPTWGPLPETQTSTDQMHNILDAKTSPALQGHMQATPKHTTLDKAEDVSSSGSLNQGHAAVTDLKILVQSENTLPPIQDVQFSNGYHAAKLRNHTELTESLFPVTDKTKVLTEKDSNESTMNSSDYTSKGLGRLDSNLKAVNWYSATAKPTTDRFNFFDTFVSPKPKTSTFSNIVTPNLKPTVIDLKYSDRPFTRTSLTNNTLVSSIMPGNTKLYSQSSKPSLAAIFFDFLDVHTSFNLAKDDFTSVTPQTKRNIEIKTTLNTEDMSQKTWHRIGSSSTMDTPLGFFSASSNLAGHVKKDTSTIATILHTSKTPQTSEYDKGLDQQRGTWFAPNWPSQKTMSTAEMSTSFNWKTTLHLDFNTFSGVTPATFQVKDKACVLQIHDPTNTQTPKSSETLNLPTVYKSSVFERETNVLSTSNFVTPVDESSLPTVYKSPVYESDTTMLSTSNSITPVDGSTLLDGTSTDDASQLATQSSITPFHHNVFNDALNGNGKINQSTLNLTSTLSSTMTPATNLWNTRTFQQFISTVHSVQKKQTSQSTAYSTDESSLTAGLKKTILPNSLAGPMGSTLKSSTSTKNLVSNIFSTSPGQPRVVTATHSDNSSKPRNVTRSLSSTFTKTQTASSITARLVSPSSKSALANATSTKVAPALKEWIPEIVNTLKPTTETPINYNAGQKVSVIPATIRSVVSRPLNFQLIGVSYSEQLATRTSDEYRKLEKEVKLVMDKIFVNKYQDDYLDMEIKAFVKGSVVVMGNVVFQSVPSGSDIIRTILTDGTKTNYFGWSINGSTVELNGYTQSNLAAESLPISFLVLRAGHIAVTRKNGEKESFLDSLQKAVFLAVNKSFPILNVSITQIRDVHGDLAIRGSLYVNSTVHTNVPSLISSLLPLVNRSVDLSSIIVNGIRIELQIHSINFRVTNTQFMLNLLDMSSSESQLLSKDLAAVMESVVHDSNPLQAIIREFRSGSVVCRGDILYRLPAPGSEEVLKLLLKNLGSDGSLGSSAYKVDFKSISVGDSRPGPAYEYIDFPGFGVAIIVMCGLCILIFPIILFVCIKTRMLGRRQKATIQRRPDLDDHSHHFEMDNRAFRASIEQP